MAIKKLKSSINENGEGLVQVPTLAGERSNESPVLLVRRENAGDVAKVVILRNKEREGLNLENTPFYVRERYHG